ncbi:hypothetical protein [Salipiger sp. PrR002]|uniref:hypothetical protein n=1 Tax=Salipiger sp. PrR002 TaxID=2706489 RepID=UPI0013B9A809|nr:hypothetical protein [Salipiger sp. PrR002]NDW01733.1 hypothetical protein [Salipiger sp. PrR002]NDW57830.1 hypothetical protein [Salipiger sp. PrR004]
MKQALRARFISTALRFKGFEPEDAILLSCDPRSGSTWLSELLCESRPSAVIWEPFHLDNAPRVRDLGFSWRQYIPPDADWPEAELFIRRMLSGGYINQWTSWASPVADFVRAEHLLVKCCRANGFLPWLVRRIAFRRKPIHFLRHPFAIAASQKRMGNFGTAGMDEVLSRGRYSEYLSEYAGFIRGLETDAERIVAMWCLMQKPALSDALTQERTIRMHYETLKLYPEREVARLFHTWGEPVPEGVLARVNQASRMTVDGALLNDPLSQVGKWRQEFSDRQVDRLARILTQLGVTEYSDALLPATELLPSDEK